MKLLNLFERKSKLNELQQESIELNRHVFDFIIKSEKSLNDLKKYVEQGNIAYKDAKLAELENNLLNMKSKLDSIKSDMQRIMSIEMDNKDFILLNDDFYLKDKINRLDTMNMVVDELLDLISERPAASELKGIIDYIYSKMSLLVDSVNNIINDDKYLNKVYSRISTL